ncbi:MAG: acyloxyacyl hydrolase [Phycisphaerales bacterium]|jgi:hypothetical protein|nr:acyloxyacyl hydrolase [Phycisphaerales bacterium]
MSITLILSTTIATSSAHTLPATPPVASVRAALASAMEPEEDRTPRLDVPWADLPPLRISDRSSWLQEATDTPDASSNHAGNKSFGAEGTTRWSITGNWGVDTKDSGNKEYGLGLGVQWFLVDDFAFAPEIHLWGFSQDIEDAFGGSLDLLFQWHILKGEGWSFYGDFGCGMLGTNHNVPADGSQFNFTPQAGVGITLDVGQDRRWIVGVRWHHISNASLYQNNPGRDSVMVYTGLSLPF